MADRVTADRTLLALAGDDPGTTGTPAELSVVELGDRLELGAETMADRIALLSTLSELEADGLVEEQTDADRTVYALTDQGRERAATRYDEVADRRVEVHDGTTEELPLAAVDQYLPEPAVARALARLTDEDVLYLEDGVEEDFVDRETERAVLADHLAATRAGEGRAVLVTGEAGVGKTTLVEEALTAVDEGRILEGVAQGDTDQPYRAVSDAVEPALAASPFDRPALDLDDPDDLEHMRTSLFADVADALLERATAAPVVLSLDDLHNAGQPTIDLLDFLARRVHEGRVLVVATSRIEGVDGEHGIHDLARDWAADDAHGRIDLSPFDRAVTRELIQASLGTRRVPGDFADLVYDRTGGTPLFVTESLAQMQEANVLAPAHDVYPTDPDEMAVSDTVEATIETRLDVLDETGERVLATAALLGEEFAVDRVVAAVDLDEASVREYLALLADVDVLRWADTDGAGAQRLWFQSGLFQETVADRIPDDQRRAYHRRIADALADRVGDDPEQAATVAHHHEQAGDDDHALVAWIDAAEYAESVYAQELAREHYEHALAIARDRDDQGQVLDILEAIGDISILVGDPEEARRAFEYVHEQAEAVARQQRAARKISTHQRELAGEPEAALDTVDRALGLAEGPPATPEACRLLIARGNAAAQLGDYQQVERAFDAAIGVAEDLEDDTLRAEALCDLVGQRALQQLGAVDEETLAVAEEVVALCEELGDDELLATALNSLSLVHSLSGNTETARAVLRRSLDLHRTLGDRLGALTNQFNITTTLVDDYLTGDGGGRAARAELEAVRAEARNLGTDDLLGMTWLYGGLLDWQGTYDYEAAVDRFERALGLFERIEHTRRTASAAGALAWVHRDAGEADRARQYADRALDLGRQTERTMFWAAAHWLRGHLALADGSVEAALADFEQAVTVAADGDHRQAEMIARAGLIDGLLAADRLADAAERAGWLRENVPDGDGPDADAVGGVPQILGKPTIEAHRALGRVARARGTHETALEEFEAGLDTARDHGDRLREARLLFEIATTHRQRSDRETAGECVDRALAIIPDLGGFGAELERRYGDVIDGV